MQNQISRTKRVKAKEFKGLVTLIKEFMVDRSSYNKNFEQLLEIFNSCYKTFYPDPSNDLRVLKYSEDMKDGKWISDIILAFQNNQVVDGVHRGIAYLRCISEGHEEDSLPKVYLFE